MVWPGARLGASIPGTAKLHRLEESIGGAAVELRAKDLADTVRRPRRYI
jgi:hypothetical protein